MEKLTAECAAEIATTYDHARDYPGEVVGEWLDCGDPSEPRPDYYDLCPAVTLAFQLMDQGYMKFSELIKELMKH